MRAIVGQQEIADAYPRFARQVSDGGTRLERTVGYKGESLTTHILWHADLQLWVLLNPEHSDNRFWCAYGAIENIPTTPISITCEINPAKEGIDRRCAGLFVYDDSGDTFLAHSGKIGRGRTGIGKTEFLNYWGEVDVESVYFPDGEVRDYIILGRIGEPDLLQRLADFVHSVARFKEATAGLPQPG